MASVTSTFQLPVATRASTGVEVGSLNSEIANPPLSPAVEAVGSSQNYSEQLEKAAGQLEKLNSMYSQQAKDSAESSSIFLKNMAKDSGTHSSYNKQVAENAEQLKMQMEINWFTTCYVRVKQLR